MVSKAKMTHNVENSSAEKLLENCTILLYLYSRIWDLAKKGWRLTGLAI